MGGVEIILPPTPFFLPLWQGEKNKLNFPDICLIIVKIY